MTLQLDMGGRDLIAGSLQLCQAKRGDGVHGLTLQRNCSSSQTNVMVCAATRMVAHELQVEEEGGGAAGSYGAKCDPGGKDEGRCVQRE